MLFACLNTVKTTHGDDVSNEETMKCFFQFSPTFLKHTAQTISNAPFKKFCAVPDQCILHNKLDSLIGKRRSGTFFDCHFVTIKMSQVSQKGNDKTIGESLLGLKMAL